ncbi:hypothetical protein LXL04_035224 [Taraxacum kok-saghyz]
MMFGLKGPSGFSRFSTAEEVTQGIDGSGLTAIVTEASSGLGTETARVLALRGVHVVMAVRNMSAVKAVKESILKQNPTAKVDAMELDLSSIASVNNFASDFKSSGLPLNLLIFSSYKQTFGSISLVVQIGYVGRIKLNHEPYFHRPFHSFVIPLRPTKRTLTLIIFKDHNILLLEEAIGFGKNLKRRTGSIKAMAGSKKIMSFRKPCIEDLPQAIMADILSRLPLKMLIRCKGVCKQLQNIVFDSYFADLQLSRSRVRFTIHYNSKILKWVAIEDELGHHNLHLDPVMSLKFKLAPIIQLVGSVNGLVCMWQDMIREGSTPTYRVSDAKVYTLGTGQWRSLSHVPYSFRDNRGVFLNGHAHWTIYHDKICAFDFDNETFELIPSPPSQRRRVYRQKLGVLKGCLCRCDTSHSKFTIWVMKEYGINESWHKELVIRKGISPTLDMLVREPPHLIGGFKDGTILISSSKGTILVYSPSTATIIDTNYFYGFTYRPSFYRLHNLKNETVQMI